MSVQDFVECRTYQFFYQSDDCLYRDHHGNRVLADAECSGTYLIEKAPAPSKIYADGELRHDTEGTFHEWITITCSEPGQSIITIQKGQRPMHFGHTLSYEKFEKCGWICGSKSLTAIDGIYDGWNEHPQLCPAPVFMSAEGIEMKISPLPYFTRILEELDTTDPHLGKKARWTVKNASRLFGLASPDATGNIVSGQVLSHLNVSEFMAEIPEGCKGVILRKLYDAFHGRQKARVLLDGQFKGWWYEPIEDRVARWKWGHFGLALRENQKEVHISIDPPAGSPLWSVSRYEILGVFES